MRATRHGCHGLHGLVLFCFAFCLTALAAGCTQDTGQTSTKAQSDTAATATQTSATQSTNDATGDTPTDITTKELFARLGQAYQDAKTYADQGKVHLHLEHEGHPVDQSADFAVTFERPNKIRMQCYQGHVVSDGTTFHAWIDDLAGQLLVREAPQTLTQDDIYVDEILTSVLTQGIAGSAPQVALLLDPEAVNAIVDDPSEAKLISSARHDKHDCYRVVLQRNGGELVMWVDQDSYVVRRIEYPTEQLTRMISSDQFQPKNVRLWVDFSDARFNVPVNALAFAFEAPANAKTVARFAPPLPPPPALSPLLGRPVADFAFVSLEGTPITPNRLRGKTAVIDLWATWCGPCMRSMPLLNKVREQFAGRDDVVFLAVSIDESSITDDQLRDKLAEIGVELPIARDPEQYARDAFNVENIPFMLVIGPDGTVEVNEVGLNPNITNELPDKLNRIVAGEHVYEEAIREHEELVKKYEAESQAANEAAAAEQPQVATVAPKSEPQNLALSQAWQTTELARPGNILVVDDPAGGQTVYVHDGWREVVQLDPAGKVVARHPLDLEDNTAVSFLRTAVDAQGARYFVGSANAQQKLYVFDANFKRILTFPDSEDDGISDVRLADLDANGSPELIVGYWGTAGVEAVSLAGEQLWSNAGPENVFRLAVAHTDPSGAAEILCTNARGSVIPIDRAGNSLDERVVQQRFLRAVEAADLDGDGIDELCAISTDAERHDEVIGLSPSGEVLWSTPLPPGLHEFPLEMVTSGPLVAGGQRVWVIGAADGSIHIVSRDGQLIDNFNYGEALAGIAVSTADGQPTLVVATASGITAWHVTQ